MTPLITRAVQLTADADQYHWFDLGEFGDDETIIDGGDPIASRIPFERCAIAFTEGGDLGALYLRRMDDGVLVEGGFVIMGGITHPYPRTRIRYEEGVGYFADDDSRKEANRQLLATLTSWMRNIDAGSTAYTITERKSLINIKRKAKGKGPMAFDWHTVVITPAQASTPQGGTHASPRAHERRGHWRTYPSGKKGWVKECKVGSSSKGIVFKDYKIKEQT